MTDLTIGGETFNVLIGGDETLPVLMLSNPLGADLHIWDAQMPELLKHFRIVRYNPRGHGSSVTDMGPYSIDRLGRDALAILDALGIEKTHWLGMSMGGAVGQWLLINAPDRIERAVLANTAAHFGSPEVWNERIVAAQEHGMEALADTVLERWFSTAFIQNHPERVEPVKQTLLATSPDGYAASCAALRDMDLREGLLRIQRPVLVVAGADDKSVSAEQTTLLAETIPGAKLVTLETRHISSLEDAAGFSKAVLDFLTSKIQVRQTSTRKAPPLPRPVARRPAGRRSPTTRGATTDTLVRRASVKGTTGKAKVIKPPVVTATPPRTRAKAEAAPAKTAPKRATAKAAPATRTTRKKPGAAAAPAKRTAAKVAPAKTVSKAATPKVSIARKTRVVPTPAKATTARTAATAKVAPRKAGGKASTPSTRTKPTATKRRAAKPAVVAKKAVNSIAAKPSTARGRVTASKTSAKRTAPTTARAATKPPAKATAKPAAPKTGPKRAIKAKAPAKTKAAASAAKTVKPASKPARKPVVKAMAKRVAPRRKA